MSSETSGSSLSDGFRSLALAPDLRDMLAGLAERVEELSERVAQATAIEAVIARADAPLAVPEPQHHGHHRDRHGMHALPGGLAACAPLAFMAHGVTAPALAAGVRWVWSSASGRAVAAVLALGTGAALAIPVTAAQEGSAATTPHPPAAVQVHHHHGQPGVPAPAAPPRARRRHHHHHHAAGASSSPAPTPVPSLPPSPAPSPGGSPFPLPTITPLPTTAPVGGEANRRLVPVGLPWSAMVS